MLSVTKLFITCLRNVIFIITFSMYSLFFRSKHFVFHATLAVQMHSLLISLVLIAAFVLIVSNTFSFFFFRDCDNLADSSERDSPWSCGGGSGGGRKPLISIIEHLRTSKSRLHNGESHFQHVYHCSSRRDVIFLFRIRRGSLMKYFLPPLMHLISLGVPSKSVLPVKRCGTDFICRKQEIFSGE